MITIFPHILKQSADIQLKIRRTRFGKCFQKMDHLNVPSDNRRATRTLPRFDAPGKSSKSVFPSSSARSRGAVCTFCQSLGITAHVFNKRHLYSVSKWKPVNTRSLQCLKNACTLKGITTLFCEYANVLKIFCPKQTLNLEQI